MSKRSAFRPRAIDRAVFAVLALLHICSGVYLIGPWYLDETDSGKAPLVSFFNDDRAVMAYGILLTIDGLLLAYATAAKVGKLSSTITSNALLAGFLLRLYALIGVFLTLDSWRPPSYLSNIATIFILGSMWVWVRVNERTVR